MTRPLIGISTELAAAIWDDRIRETVLSPAACSLAVERAGGTAVLLPPVLPTAGRSQLEHGAQLERSAGRLVRALDGLVFRAGPRAAFGESWTADQPSRPDLGSTAPQAALIKAALAGGVPFLALGPGLLTLNLVTGGTLESSSGAGASPASAGNGSAGNGSSDNGSAAGSADNGGAANGGAANGSAVARGAIQISPGKLEQILGTSITVQPQGPAARRPRAGGGPAGRLRLAQLGNGLSAVARSADDRVLAVEATEHPFGIGVSWQPGDDDIRLLAALCAAASQDQHPVTQPVS